MTARRPNGDELEAGMATGLVVTGVPGDESRATGFAPFWFISKRAHFTSADPRVSRNYPGDAMGRLIFEAVEGLPHRRLFRAT